MHNISYITFNKQFYKDYLKIILENLKIAI